MAAYGSRNTSRRAEGNFKKKNIPFYLRSKKPFGKSTLLTGTEAEQRAIWEKEKDVPDEREVWAAHWAGVDISPKKKKTRKLLAKAAKARAKRK